MKKKFKKWLIVILIVAGIALLLYLLIHFNLIPQSQFPSAGAPGVSSSGGGGSA